MLTMCPTIHYFSDHFFIARFIYPSQLYKITQVPSEKIPDSHTKSAPGTLVAYTQGASSQTKKNTTRQRIEIIRVEQLPSSMGRMRLLGYTLLDRLHTRFPMTQYQPIATLRPHCIPEEIRRRPIKKKSVLLHLKFLIQTLKNKQKKN